MKCVYIWNQVALPSYEKSVKSVKSVKRVWKECAVIAQTTWTGGARRKRSSASVLDAGQTVGKGSVWGSGDKSRCGCCSALQEILPHASNLKFIDSNLKCFIKWSEKKIKKKKNIEGENSCKKLCTVYCVANNVGKVGGFKASLSHGGSTLGNQLSSVRGTFNGVF